MRSLTLSGQSVFLRAHSSSSSSSKPPKTRQLDLNARFSDEISKLSHRNSSLFLSSCAKLQSMKMYKEFTFLNSNALKETKLAKNVDEYGVSDNLLSKGIIGSRNDRSEDVPDTDTSFHSYLKFVLLFGLFTLEGTQKAVASSDFASGLQSMSFLGDLGDISTGFASAFLLIFFSELGDKTFFIAALLAARNSGAVVFVGTFGALATMTLISVALGRTFHYVDDILPFRFGEVDLPVDDIAAVCLLVYFGVSTLLEATSSDVLKAEEEQKEAELAVSEFSGNGAGILAAANTVVSTFLLVFVAEWGDKSFFSTIALAAASSPLGVIGGALAGHGVATLLVVLGGSLLTTFLKATVQLAVLGGSLLGTFLSEKVIAYIGGVLFLVFAAVTLIEIVG